MTSHYSDDGESDHKCAGHGFELCVGVSPDELTISRFNELLVEIDHGRV